MASEGQTPDEEEPRAIGWGAIDAALAPVYGGEDPPYHYAPIPPAMLGGDDPLQGISVYVRQAPVPHWHFVTYGFSELYEKESDDPQLSGFGFELTFRLALTEGGPPSWALSFLQNLARYVFQTGNGFDVGHYLDCNGPIALGVETAIRAVVFALDPELGAVETPNGLVVFLQVVGITLDELRQIKKWNAQGFLELIGPRVPLLITDLGRHSLLEAADLRREIQERADKEGSKTSHLAVGEAHFSVEQGRAHVVFGANGLIDLKEILPIRLKFGEPLTVASSRGRIRFSPGEAAAWNEDAPDQLTVTLPPEPARRLGELLQTRAGTYALPEMPDLVFEVRRSEIKDQDGNTVEVIG